MNDLKFVENNAMDYNKINYDNVKMIKLCFFFKNMSYITMSI